MRVVSVDLVRTLPAVIERENERIQELEMFFGCRVAQHEATSHHDVCSFECLTESTTRKHQRARRRTSQSLCFRPCKIFRRSLALAERAVETVL